MRRNSVLDILEERLPALVEGYGLKSLHLFGSTATDDARPNSDVDFLVEFERPTFENYIGLKLELEEMLGTPVDLVSPSKIPSELRGGLEREALPIVERSWSI
ncbi:MAG: nucleotidyltransferase family protein [Thermaceae bacterium]|nr:nucleotidyltransferase family protein [Thermaceae bacterium]